MRSFDAFDHGDGRMSLQRDDCADVFPDDDAAWLAFIGRLERIQQRSRNATDQSALEIAISLLNNWRQL